MRKQQTWTLITVIVTLAVIFTAGTVSIALGTPLLQPEATQQQQTVDAVIAERFTQTAAVQQSLGATQTAEAATQFAPTLTAEFEATVDAAFNNALTATAEGYITATAQVENQLRDQVIVWESQVAEGIIARFSETVTARQNELIAVAEAGSATFNTLLQTPSDAAEFGDRQAAAAALLAGAAGQNPSFNGFLIANAAGDVIAASDDADVITALANYPFFPDMLAEARVNPVIHEPESKAPVLLVSLPVVDANGMAVGVLAGRVNLEPFSLIIEQALSDNALPVVIYTVSGAEGRVVVPANIFGLSGYPVLQNDGAQLGASEQSGSGTYENEQTTPPRVIGVVRYIPTLGLALIVEVPVDQAELVVANLPTPTAPPASTPTVAPGSPTPRPAIFPTDTVAEVAIAEQVFEHGRMFWIRYNRQIWVMVDDPDPNYPGGDWYCYNDTFEEGEPEIDPDIIPPEDRLQPRRGFGKLWRNIPMLRESLGWAITPEFELTSRYTYIAGGYVENGQYIPGPGEHRLVTLYNESISFYEREIRGDCLGGTWRQTGQ